MRRSLRADELRLWADVAASVRPLPGRAPPAAPADPVVPPPPLAGPAPGAGVAAPAKGDGAAVRERPRGPDGARGPTGPPPSPTPPPFPDAIEPMRRRRIIRGRDPIGSRLDLHGLDQDRARAALVAFLQGAHQKGLRAVLVITGKGSRGDGVLRRRAPEWLEDPTVRQLIAGVSPADRRHGGDGAFYVALRRRS